jgi:hypothetical protein
MLKNTESYSSYPTILPADFIYSFLFYLFMAILTAELKNIWKKELIYERMNLEESQCLNLRLTVKLQQVRQCGIEENISTLINGRELRTQKYFYTDRATDF